MRAYEYVYLAVLEPLLYVGNLLCGAQAAYVFHRAGKILKALPEGVVVLQRKDGSGHQHRHLLTVANGLESGPDGDFRLAEAHVAADQTVHRAVVLHIHLDGLGGGLLVRGVLIHEGGFEFVLEVGVGGIGIALGSPAFGVELYEFLGNVLDLGFGAVLQRCPGPGSYLVDARDLSVTGTEAGDLVQRMYGNEYHVAVLVGYLHHLGHPALVVALADEASEYAHAVVYMHHVVSYVEGIQVVEGQLLGLLHAAAYAGPVETVEYLVVGIAADLVFGVYETAVDVLPRLEFGQQAAVLGEDGLHPFQLGRLLPVDYHAIARFQPAADVGGKEFEILVEGRLRADGEADRFVGVGGERYFQINPLEPEQGCVERTFLVHF